MFQLFRALATIKVVQLDPLTLIKQTSLRRFTSFFQFTFNSWPGNSQNQKFYIYRKTCSNIPPLFTECSQFSRSFFFFSIKKGLFFILTRIQCITLHIRYTSLSTQTESNLFTLLNFIVFQIDSGENYVHLQQDEHHMRNKKKILYPEKLQKQTAQYAIIRYSTPRAENISLVSIYH